MTRLIMVKPLARIFTLVLLSAAVLFTTACAPSSGMAATLTMLPGTFTPLPGKRYPTVTPHPTNTLSPIRRTLGTSTPGGETEPTPEPSSTVTIPPTRTTDPNSGCPEIQYDQSVPSPDTVAGYIGRHYNPLLLPPELKALGSGLLQDSSSSWVQLEWQGRNLFWIQKLVCRNSAGQAYWEVVDALALPPFQKHEAVADLCYQGGQLAPYIIAYGPSPAKASGAAASTLDGGSKGWPVQVTAAYQMDGRFSSIDPQTLTCIIQDQGD